MSVKGWKQQLGHCDSSLRDKQGGGITFFIWQVGASDPVDLGRLPSNITSLAGVTLVTTLEGRYCYPFSQMHLGWLMICQIILVRKLECSCPKSTPCCFHTLEPWHYTGHCTLKSPVTLSLLLKGLPCETHNFHGSLSADSHWNSDSFQLLFQSPIDYFRRQKVMVCHQQGWE